MDVLLLTGDDEDEKFTDHGTSLSPALPMRTIESERNEIPQFYYT